MKTQSSRIEQIIVIRLNSGEDILLGIRAAVAQHGLKSALLLGAMGSVQLSRARGRVERAAAQDIFLKGESRWTSCRSTAW